MAAALGVRVSGLAQQDGMNFEQDRQFFSDAAKRDAPSRLEIFERAAALLKNLICFVWQAYTRRSSAHKGLPMAVSGCRVGVPGDGERQFHPKTCR